MYLNLATHDMLNIIYLLNILFELNVTLFSLLDLYVSNTLNTIKNNLFAIET